MAVHHKPEGMSANAGGVVRIGQGVRQQPPGRLYMSAAPERSRCRDNGVGAAAAILGRPMALPSIGSLLRLAAVDTRPLRRRDFSLLFCGQLVSHLGTMVTAVAVPYQLYQLTHSTLAVGLLGLVELCPVLAFAFLGGALADALDRRLMVLLTELVFMATSALLTVNALLGRPLLWAIYGLAAIQAGLYALQRPSLDALLPRLVPESEMTAAGALASLRGSVGMVA